MRKSTVILVRGEDVGCKTELYLYCTHVCFFGALLSTLRFILNGDMIMVYGWSVLFKSVIINHNFFFFSLY